LTPCTHARVKARPWQQGGIEQDCHGLDQHPHQEVPGECPQKQPEQQKAGTQGDPPPFPPCSWRVPALPPHAAAESRTIPSMTPYPETSTANLAACQT